jgi:protein SCO1/2
MTKNLKKIQDALSDEEDFRIVTITVDPERDTPERLIEFAKEHGANLEKWLFLRGDKKYVFDLSTEGFKLSAYEVPSSEPGGQSGFVHSERFMLVDKQGLIQESFRGTQSSETTKLIDSANQLLHKVNR